MILDYQSIPIWNLYLNAKFYKHSHSSLFTSQMNVVTIVFTSSDPLHWTERQIFLFLNVLAILKDGMTLTLHCHSGFFIKQKLALDFLKYLYKVQQATQANFQLLRRGLTNSCNVFPLQATFVFRRNLRNLKKKIKTTTKNHMCNLQKNLKS